MADDDIQDILDSVPSLVSSDVAQGVTEGLSVEDALRRAANVYLSLAIIMFHQLPVERQALISLQFLASMPPEQRARMMGID